MCLLAEDDSLSGYRVHYEVLRLSNFSLFQEGKVVEALDVFTSVIQKAQSSNNEEFVYTIKLKLGVILIELRKYEEAEKLLFEVIDHLDKKHHDTSPLTVVYANYQLGRVYQNLQQIRYALLI